MNLLDLLEWDNHKLSIAAEPLSHGVLAEKDLEDPLVALDCCHYAGLFIRGCYDDDPISVTDEVVNFYKFLVGLEIQMLHAVKLNDRVYGALNEDRTKLVFFREHTDGSMDEIVSIDKSDDLQMHICQLVGFYFPMPISMEDYEWLQSL